MSVEGVKFEKKFPTVFVAFIFILIAVSPGYGWGRTLKISEQEVAIISSVDGVRLSGTLSLPQRSGKMRALLLIQGSGPLDRDSRVFGHRLFKVIADRLVSAGMVVLRMDRRGTGKSQGVYYPLDLLHFTKDADDAFCWLKKLDSVEKNVVGILGHSLGGLIASKVASENRGVKFLVLLSYPGIWGEEIIRSQNRSWARLSGKTSEEISEVDDLSQRLCQLMLSGSGDEGCKIEFIRLYERISFFLKPALRRMFFSGPADLAYLAFTTEQFKAGMSFQPVKQLISADCPVLVLSGEKDCFLPFGDNAVHIDRVMRTRGKGKDRYIVLKGHNHHLQWCNSGGPEEMAGIKEAISPMAMNCILQWLKGFEGGESFSGR